MKMTLEDRLAVESKRIVRNAKKLHKRKRLDHSMYLSRNGSAREMDIIHSPMDEVEKYIDSYKKKGRFYLIGVNDINPRRLIINSFIDFIYSTLFCRGLSSFGDVKFKRMIYHKLGMNIGKNVHIYQGAKFDIIFSRLIEIGDNSTIGGETTIYNHGAVASKDYFGWGIVKIGRNCTIGNHCLIAGLNMEDGSSLMPGTVTAGYPLNFAAGKIYGGNPPRLIEGTGR